MLSHRSAERIAFGYLVSQKFTGEKATLEVRTAFSPLSSWSAYICGRCWVPS